MTKRFLVIALFLAQENCHAAPQRYVMQTQPSGDILLHPVPAEDVNGDGRVSAADSVAVLNAITLPKPTTQPATQPEVPPYVPPVTTQPAPGDRVLTTLDSWQLAVSNAKPGDTVWFHGGDYRKASGGQNYEATLSINCSGEPGKPVTIRNVPGERPIFYGTGKTYAIVVGYIKYDGTKFGVHDVIVDGLAATQSPWDGISVVASTNVALRNCSAYANNYNSPNGYKAGFNVEASSNVSIEKCRAYDNGEGIVIGSDQAGVADPTSVTGIVIRDCFIYGNSRSANLGNSSGIELWFTDQALIQGNILWDNPDANFNGQGVTRSRYIGNIAMNSWQEGGNNEGFKSCVRGGGCNVIAGNTFANNSNCGLDAAAGVGDLLVGNTLYGNGSWGILLEGSETAMWNNIIASNSTRGGNGYIEIDALGFSLISDWNVFGALPLPYTRPTTPIPFPPNSRVQPVNLAGFKIPRNGPRQVLHPESLFGSGDIEAVRAKLFALYKPAVAIPGASMASIQKACSDNIPTVKAALDAMIADKASSPDFQMKQATSRWQALKAGLTSYDLSGLGDGGYCGAVK